MTDYGHELQFGVFITPDAGQADAVVELSKLADLVGLDLVTFQDHPYQARFLDTWTLISVVAAQTTNVRLAPNVVNLPLRPPVVLARSVASLDILSGGRVELGLGAGAFWDGIAALGGPQADARPVGRRARRGDRGHPRLMERGRRPDPPRGRALPDRRRPPRARPGARRRDLARRLQAPDAGAHRRQGGRLAAEPGLRRARRPAGHERCDRPRRRGGRSRAGRGAPAVQRQRVVRERRRVPRGCPARLGASSSAR